jgi:hypothetical protein
MRKTCVNLDIDEPLTLLVDALPGRLESLRRARLESRATQTPDEIEAGRELLDEDGTLILVVRSSCRWDNFDGFLDSDNGQVLDRHGVLFNGGLVFVEGAHRGIDLEGQDPIRIIEHSCLSFAGREYDRTIPGLVPSLTHINEERQKAEERRTQVQARARTILLAHLNDEQKEELEASRYFHVRGADGFLYRIIDKFQHNVFRVEDGRDTFEYCIVTKTHVPIHDQMLAQALLLMANPSMFHEVTNTWALTEDGRRVFQPKVKADAP